MMSVPENVEALYEYEANDDSELNLRVGLQLEILEKTDADWWRGRDLDR
jgi:hypothetical protein